MKISGDHLRCIPLLTSARKSDVICSNFMLERFVVMRFVALRAEDSDHRFQVSRASPDALLN